MIEIRCHTEPGGLVIEVVGDLTIATAPVLRSCLEGAIEAELRSLILDVGSVRRIDRAVAITLLELDRGLAAVGGSLVLRNLDGCLDEVGSVASPRRDRAVSG